MIISVASGKGGTGKTTVTSSLVSVWDKPVAAVDLDVEEPNLHLFLRPEIDKVSTVDMEIPKADDAKCTHCRKCADLCSFKAITVMAETLLVFEEMCHGCGGCLAICPEDALTPGARPLGTLEEGKSGDKPYLMGRLRIGEAMSPPLMRHVKKRLDQVIGETGRDAIIDSPPGVSCPAVASVIDSDFIVLVTEPTPFGFHDFKLAWEAFTPLGKPMGVVVNRAGIGDRSVQDFCAEKGLPILAEIPFDRAVAEGYSKGQVVAEVSDDLKRVFESLRDAIRREAAHA
ncbi:4Fe-4S binding protein [Pseudodesulfovibrio tunisiensis]|uniref:nucleotide-binding protein n=1 Tax=Pseudodesulfovibrio tunisiensis TaxID=463192 RepID=UPI001FB382DA|nr:ATP-binding protein [Pseudodesulfovibrio tunisiensis]